VILILTKEEVSEAIREYVERKYGLVLPNALVDFEFDELTNGKKNWKTWTSELRARTPNVLRTAYRGEVGSGGGK
jgi:hypothetical protein